jgi:putative serine protease PepD
MTKSPPNVDLSTGWISSSGATATLATDALPSDNAVSHLQQRGRARLTHIGTLILYSLTEALFSAAIGAVAAIHVHPPTMGNELFVPNSAVGRSAINVPVSPLEQMVATVLPSVVTLQTDQTDESELGSGIVLTADGMILTNSHVVASVANAAAQSSAVVKFHDGRSTPFTVLATDPKDDVAVVRAQGVSGLTPISFGTSNDLRVGQQVVAVGSPLGLGDTVTAGVISGLSRPVLTDTDNQVAAYDAIQTDAALNPGNSGGALVDMNGRLVGMNSAAPDRLGAVELEGSIGIGFAIPVDNAKWIARELMTTGRVSHASLGAQVSDDDNSNGARIIDVTDGGPAAAAGLPDGALVTKFDDQAIENGAALVAAVQSRTPGTRVIVDFIDRAGDHRSVHVTLGADEGPR